jgi:hypothetical protein
MRVLEQFIPVLLLSISVAQLPATAQYKLQANKTTVVRLTRPALPLTSQLAKIGVTDSEFDLKSVTVKQDSLLSGLSKQTFDLPAPIKLSKTIIQKAPPSGKTDPVDYDAIEAEYAAAAPPLALPGPNTPEQLLAQGGGQLITPAMLSQANRAGGIQSQPPTGPNGAPQNPPTSGWLAAGNANSPADFTLAQLKNMQIATLEAQKSGTLIWNKQGTLWSPSGNWAMGPDGKVYTAGDPTTLLAKYPSLGAMERQFATWFAKNNYGPGGYRRGSEYTPAMPTSQAVQATVQARMAGMMRR